MPEKLTATAADFVARIRSNVNDWYEDVTDYAEFTRRQGATWDAVKAAGPQIDAEVLRILREEPAGARS